jgi:predicted ATPase/DNA-binding SARP family transcriptional activator
LQCACKPALLLPNVGAAARCDEETPVDLRVLGPVEAVDEGGSLALGGTRPRTLIAALALADAPVSADRLIHEVWRDAPPRSATSTLHSYVSRLRRVLGRDRLPSQPAGYLLKLAPDELDIARFDRAVALARAARDAGRRDAAIAAYDAALGVWRGEVAEGLDPGAIIRGAAARLQEQRLLATEERVEVLLSAGRHHEVVGELEALVGLHPHRERLHAQRLVALYRSGRQADALKAYQEARNLLVASLGIEPGPQLRELHRRVLDQDPSLGVRAATVPDATVVAGVEVPTSGRTAGNLAAPLSTFVGRVAARRDIAARLAGDARLVTLVGAGGCGKTQLALRVAADAADGYPEGAWWVELAAQQGSDRVLRSVADALGLGASVTVDRLLQVAGRLGTGRHLLILDNCEHLVDACADLVSELLRRCPDLRILATSREPLDVDGEQVWRVPSLGLPAVDGPPEQALASEAAQLLALRGREVRPDLTFAAEDAPTVARICRELDGIPLALELAAARLNVLSLDELADRLRDRFAVLAHGRRSAPARHRTLEAAIAWSYDLLDPRQRRLLTRLTVFARGCAVADAEVVCGHDGEVFDLLAALVDKSLVQRSTDPDGRARLDLLVTVRSFAAARADPDDLREVVRRHAEHFTDMAERAAPELTGPRQVEGLNRLHLEQGNLRMVLERGDRLSARVAAAVWWFWLQFGHAVEGDRWMRGLLADGSDLDDQRRLDLHRGAARLAVEVDEPARAVDHLDVALELAARRSATSFAAQDHALRARIVAGLGDDLDATRSLEQARRLATEAADPWTHAAVEHQAAVVAWHNGALEDAADAAAAAEAGFRSVGDRWTACLARLDGARIARLQGRREQAATLHRTNLAHGLELTVSSFDFVGLPQDLQGLALLAIEDGRAELAATLLGAAAELRTAVALPGSTAARHDELFNHGAGALDPATFDQAFARGRQGSAEQAVQLALTLTEDRG